MPGASTFHSFRLIENLGEGAAGNVHLATPLDRRTYARPGDALAIKIYKPAILTEPRQEERIRQEFEVGSTITHPNLVKIHEYVPAANGDPPYLIMEYVDGMALSQWLTHFHPISGRLLIRIAKQLASAVEQLHRHGITHRDIKPSNIMLSSDFSVRLMDFGVVHISSVKEDSPQTPEGRFLGTIRNAAPEYLFDGHFDEKTDIYSLGTVLYALLHGQEVFADKTQWAQLVAALRTTEPDWDPTLDSRGTLVTRLRSLAGQLLARTPDQRPTAVELCQRLNEIEELAPESVEVEPLHGYLACGLTGLDGDSREAIMFVSDKIAEVAKSFDLYVYEPRKATDPLLAPEVADTVVYELDRKRVLSADVLFVLANKPSFGVGQEIEIAASYGKPILLIAREGTTISRMVTGSYVTVLDEVVFYKHPEDLARKVRTSLTRAVPVLRRQPQPFLPRPSELGSRVTEYRKAAGYDSPGDVAEELRISPRLIEALEAGKLENIGLRILQRIATVLQVEPMSLLQADPAPPTTSRDDVSIRNLSRVAENAGWSHADYVELLSEYRRELAASGGVSVLRQQDWVDRHTALERRRIADNSQRRQQRLF